MKYQIGSNGSNKFLLSLLFGIVMGFASLFVILLLFSLITTLADLGDVAISVLSTVAIVISSFICGFLSAKRLGSKALIIGVVSGFVFYITVAIISLITTKDSFSSLFLIRLALSVVMSAVGAIVATQKKSNKNII